MVEHGNKNYQSYLRRVSNPPRANGPEIRPQTSRLVEKIMDGWQSEKVCNPRPPSRVLYLACRDSRPSNTDSYVSRFKETTPYAIVNMSAAVKEMREYINRHVFQCVEYWLDGRDDWIQETYRFARQYMKTAVSETGTLSTSRLLTKHSR